MNLNLFAFATFSMIIIFMCIIFIIRKSIFFNSQEKDLLQEVFYNSMELRLYIPLQAFSTLCTLCVLVYVCLYTGKEVFGGAFSFHVSIYSKHSTLPQSRHSKNEWPTKEKHYTKSVLPHLLIQNLPLFWNFLELF